MEMTQRSVSQAANTPRLTLLPLRKTSSVLTSALSLVQPTGPVLQATNNHPFNFHTSLYAIWTPTNQDLNMAESLDPNCKLPFKTTNSATEFDTELFQTDIRELSQELPEHADDPNPVQDDTHGFLPENATASRKIRDKRKRKTPKTTAVNQQKPSQSNGMVFALNF
ncbi:hypothetical protein ACTXT7_014053 [Hymenolepis weldensis]